MKINLDELDFINGSFLPIIKPSGITSFGLVHQVKKWTKAKVGHAGTLDPLADGLMILCTGKWTKKLQDWTGKDKCYTGIIRLGASTPTYDLESTPEHWKSIEEISIDKIETARKKFLGDIMQFPPAHSAIKVDGKVMYEMARKGEEIKLQARAKIIYSFDLDTSTLPELHFKVCCSSGTYIRSLAHDIGLELGCGAFLQKLSRISIGAIDLSQAYTFEEMKKHFGSQANLKQIIAKEF